MTAVEIEELRGLHLTPRKGEPTYDLEGYEKEFFHERTELYEWVFFLLPLRMSQRGQKLRAINFRQDPTGWLMVVKIESSGIPLVGFVNAATPTGCIQILRRLIADGHTRWYEDKFA